MTLTLNRQLLTSRQILVAFSGGLDSTVLLHQLVQWRAENPGVTLRAIHVHHGLSANADAWVRHCENICQQWQVPLVVERVQLAQEGLGIEAQARQARYQAFARTLLPGEVLVTAQHLDDQCETFLLALKRGSGPAGLSAMGKFRSLPEHGLSARCSPARGENWCSGRVSMIYAGLKTKVIRMIATIVTSCACAWCRYCSSVGRILPKQRPAALRFALNKRAC